VLLRGSNRVSKASLLLVAVLAGGLAGAPVAAADDDGRAGGWRFEVTPYIWLPEIHGDVRIRDRSADFEVGFDDVFDLLGDGDLFGAMGHFEARSGRLALFADVVGTVVDDETDGQIARQDVDVDLDADFVTAEFGAAYRFLARDRFDLEGLAGGRYNYWYSEVTVKGPLQERRRDTSQEFVDPFFGLRGGVRLAEQWSLVARGDVGGFGAGSELAWLALGGVRWDMPWRLGAASLAAFAVYKVYDLDYETGAGGGERALDIQLRGPALGLGFNF